MFPCRSRLLPLMLIGALVMAGPALLCAEDVANLRRTYVVETFEQCRESVVNINSTFIIRQRFGSVREHFFRQFFDVPDLGRNVKRTSLGSGLVIHSDGYVVTNAHVVDGAVEIEVILADGSALPAKVLSSDTQHDLAILKVQPPQDVPLKPAVLGVSDDLMVGEPVVAIGNPLGYAHTVTTGIISAVDREFELSQNFKISGLIQTDTSINPGNSGGPLLNAYGQVIGINTAIRSDAQNIGFAIGVNQLRELIPELLSPLVIRRADVGGHVTETTRIDLPADVATELFWHGGREAEPVPLTAVGGVPVGNIIEACVELLRYSPGESFKVSTADAELTVAVRPAPPSDGQRLARNMIGARVRAVNAEDRSRLQAARLNGVIIDALESQGPSHLGGLERDDIIYQIERYRIGSLADLAAVLQHGQRGSVVRVAVLRRTSRGWVRGWTRLSLRMPQQDAL